MPVEYDGPARASSGEERPGTPGARSYCPSIHCPSGQKA